MITGKNALQWISNEYIGSIRCPPEGQWIETFSSFLKNFSAISFEANDATTPNAKK
jgi:hypothetical protein